ncbi:hypothetical protein HY477_01985 [Candidatus Uhrbacteria bacterium]|nr:hypothetical protein [Candidatus Uhrbacteria bacterium]
MSRLVYFILLVSFLSIAVFGFAGIGHQGCIAELAKGPACTVTEGLGIADFHISAFKSFSLAISSIMLTLAAAAAIWMRWVSVSSALTAPVRVPRIRATLLTALGMTNRWLIKINHWHALHEMRDAGAAAKGA